MKTVFALISAVTLAASLAAMASPPPPWEMSGCQSFHQSSGNSAGSLCSTQDGVTNLFYWGNLSGATEAGVELCYRSEGSSNFSCILLAHELFGNFQYYIATVDRGAAQHGIELYFQGSATNGKTIYDSNQGQNYHIKLH